MGALTTNHGSRHGMARRRRRLLAKEMYRSLGRRMSTSIGPRILPPHLREGLFLDILYAFLQGNHLGGQGINHLAMGLAIGLEVLDLYGLLLRPPNEIVDHIGQLIYLYVLKVNAFVRLIHDTPYTIHGIPNEVGLFLQPVDRMVLETTHVPQLRLEAMDLGQQLSPDGGGVLGVSLAPHLALSLFRFKQPPLQ
jgi:hypothetical protein